MPPARALEDWHSNHSLVAGLVVYIVVPARGWWAGLDTQCPSYMMRLEAMLDVVYARMSSGFEVFAVVLRLDYGGGNRS